MSGRAFYAVLILLGCLFAAALLLQHCLHMRHMKKLNQDLDKLLQQGIPLPINQYREGELSILANQMEKITLRLTENASRVQREKEGLSNSLADISHQLRTPMTAMNLAVTMLRSPQLAHERRMELTAELRKQLARMDWLVETLLKISKLDAGTINMNCESVAVAQLIDRAAEPFAISMELKNQRLEVSCNGAALFCDIIWTAEAIGNIIKNCMEHNSDCGTISIFATETPLFTEIRIDDTGEGFKAEDIPHLFDRFYQGRNAGKHSYGIGLALARAIIASQNGTIKAMNIATGARFVIKFYKRAI